MVLFQKEISEFDRYDEIVEMDNPGGFKPFVIRVRNQVSGSIAHPEEGYLVGFSTKCTHMGCPVEPDVKNMICGPCICHGTVFDLTKGGLVVIGHATQNLSQLDLKLLYEDNLIYVYATDWLENTPAQADEPTTDQLKFTDAVFVIT